jgi:hypothetical protein
MIKKPYEYKYPKNDVEVGDVHQPLKKTHLLLWSAEPFFGLPFKPTGHFLHLS